MNRFILFLLFSLSCNIINAQKWDRKLIKTFNQSNVLKLQVDMSNANMENLDSAKFVTYIAGKDGKSPEYIGLVFKMFREKLQSSLEKYTKKTIVLANDSHVSDFCLLYKIHRITENAGISGELYVVYKEHLTNARIYDFQLEDGRWNTFDKLLLEAAEKLGKHIRQLNSWEVYDGYEVNTRNKVYKLRKS